MRWCAGKRSVIVGQAIDLDSFQKILIKIKETSNKDRYTGRYHDWQISCFFNVASRWKSKDLTATAELEFVDLSASPPDKNYPAKTGAKLHGLHPSFGT